MSDETTTPTETTVDTTPVETKTEAAPGPGPSLIPKTEAAPTTEEKPNPENYLGTYKTREDAEKGLKELRTKLAQKQPVIEVPENYEFKDVLDQGLQFENEEHQTAVATMLKDAGVPQAMLAKLAPISKDLTERAFKAGEAAVMQKVIDTYGEPLDQAKEIDALKQEWGDNYEAELKAVADFTAKLPRELFKAPLDRSAAGLKFLREYQKLTRGADFIQDSEPASADGLEAERDRLMQSEAYWKPMHLEHKATHARVRQISERLSG